MPDALLKIEDLAAGYGDVQVLWDIELDITPEEIVCIVGSNGAGKTTLLHTISGLVGKFGGRIEFAGHDITQASAHDVLAAGIAHVPEGRRLFKGLTVEDNLLLGAYLRNDRAGIRHDLEYVYTLFPILSERRRQDAFTMSGGEQQMCAIGRGIMSRPTLLMIDELSLGLAPALVERLADALRRINEDGLTILLVEQDVMAAFELAQRAFVIETGKVTISGPTRVLADDPRIRQAYLGM